MIREHTKIEYEAVCDKCLTALSTLALNKAALSRFAAAARWLEPEPGVFTCRRCQVLEQPPVAP